MSNLWSATVLLWIPIGQELPPRMVDTLSALRSGHWEEAVESLTSVVEANPQDGLGRYYLGTAQLALCRYEAALPELRRSVELGVDGSRHGMRSAHLALARGLAQTGNADGALAHLEEAWGRWGFDDLRGVLADEAYEILHDDPRLRALAGLDPAADAGDRDARWRADLRYFQRLLASAHPAPFRGIREDAWTAELEALDASIETSSDLEITGELMRLAALIGDGHTAIYPPTEGAASWHLLPFFPICLSDGWFVAAASAEGEEIVGARIIGAGDAPWDAQVRYTGQRLARDNEFTPRWLAAIGLQFAEPYALASGSADSGTITLALELRDGQRVDRTLQGGPPTRDPNSRWAPEGWVTAYERAPLWLQHPDRAFHHQRLDEPGVIYSQINQTLDTRDKTLAGYGRELREFFEQEAGRTLILDVRLNNGGNAYHARGLINELLRIRALEAPGALLVLIGPRTFSATGYLLGMLEKHLEPTLIGWPTGCRPVGYSSERSFQLPYSNLAGTISWEFRVDGRGSDDLRPSFVPDWVVWPSGEDLRQGRDPVLEAATTLSRR